MLGIPRGEAQMTEPVSVPLSIALLTAGASGVLGALIGEGFAFLRENKRAAAEAKERESQRLHELRRDVYLHATSTSVSLLAAIGRLGNPGIPQEESERASEAFNTAMAKIHMVAGPGTIRRVAQLQRAIVPLHLDLFADRAPIVLRQLEINRTQQTADAHLADTHRFVEMMRMMNINGERNAERFAAIERQADSAASNHQAAASRVNELWETQLAQQRGFVEKLLPRLEQIAERQMNCLVAIRSELGVDGAVDVLKQELADNLTTIRETLKRVLQKLHTPPDAGESARDEGRR
jgi:hypothetical protein